MPKIIGLKERKHRPLLVCSVCGEDPETRCPLCGGNYCLKHREFHSCHATFLARIRGQKEDINWYHEELKRLETDLELERWEASLPSAPNHLVEALADIAHESWTGWMKYMVSKIKLGSQRQTRDDGHLIEGWLPRSLVERWRRQMATPYGDLPESEKASDRVEAQEYIDAMGEEL